MSTRPDVSATDRRARDMASPFVHALILCLLCIVTYAGSIDGAFVSDDIHMIGDDPLLSSLSPANIGAIFKSRQGPNYVPITELSLAIDGTLFGRAPTAHHVTNVVIHIGCVLLVYAILRRLRLSPLFALLTAALWAVHPVQVESVAWISERKNVLSGLFFFAAFLTYLDLSDRPRTRTYVALLALYVLALLSKMNTMVLPAVCLAYELTWNRRLRGRDVGTMIPLFALAALVAWYNLSGNAVLGESAWWGGSRIVTWLSSSVIPFRYLGNLVLPIDLRPVYEVPLRGSPLDPPVLAALLGLAGLVAVSILLIARRRREVFWILWSALTLLPMLNVLVPFRSMMNDRYLYLALVGPLALVAFLLDALPASVARRGAAGVAGLAVIACAVLSIRQVEIWSTPFSYWAALADRPLLGADPVIAEPDYEKRLAFLQTAIAATPSSGALHNNLGALYYTAGRLPEALTELEEANRLSADDPTILLNLGRARLQNGKASEAEPALERAVELRPYDFLSHLYLIRFHVFVDRDVARARAVMEAAMRLQPESVTRMSLRREREALAALP
jgi:cytochrome c-type biogenesis protein CcmH/NrfG